MEIPGEEVLASCGMLRGVTFGFPMLTSRFMLRSVFIMAIRRFVILLRSVYMYFSLFPLLIQCPQNPSTSLSHPIPFHSLTSYPPPFSFFPSSLSLLPSSPALTPTYTHTLTAPTFQNHMAKHNGNISLQYRLINPLLRCSAMPRTKVHRCEYHTARSEEQWVRSGGGLSVCKYFG